jgi:hypothetical protein
MSMATATGAESRKRDRLGMESTTDALAKMDQEVTMGWQSSVLV